MVKTDFFTKVIVTLFIFFIAIKGSFCVRFRDFKIPKEARAGENVTLLCQVETYPSPLYSLAWWKDGVQFYRVAVTKNYRDGNSSSDDHHPMSSTSRNFAKIFPVDGMEAKAGRRMGEVILQIVEATASGTYTCEAVADFPTFSQSKMSAKLIVVEPPATKPIISGFKGQYYPGEVLNTNCTILRSYPAASVSWSINEEKLKSDVIEARSHPDMTLTLVDRLTLRLHKHHFENDSFNLTCGAHIGQFLYLSTSMTAHHARLRSHKKIRHIQTSSRNEVNKLYMEEKELRSYSLMEKHEGLEERHFQRLHSAASITTPGNDLYTGSFFIWLVIMMKNVMQTVSSF